MARKKTFRRKQAGPPKPTRHGPDPSGTSAQTAIFKTAKLSELLAPAIGPYAAARSACMYGFWRVVGMTERMESVDDHGSSHPKTEEEMAAWIKQMLPSKPLSELEALADEGDRDAGCDLGLLHAFAMCGAEENSLKSQHLWIDGAREGHARCCMTCAAFKVWGMAENAIKSDRWSEVISLVETALKTEPSYVCGVVLEAQQASQEKGIAVSPEMEAALAEYSKNLVEKTIRALSSVGANDSQLPSVPGFSFSCASCGQSKPRSAFAETEWESTDPPCCQSCCDDRHSTAGLENLSIQEESEV